MGEVVAVRIIEAFNGRSDQWLLLVSLPFAARAPMGTNTIKTRRRAGAQTIDFPGFMRDVVIARFYSPCRSFFQQRPGGSWSPTRFNYLARVAGNARPGGPGGSLIQCLQARCGVT